VLNTDNMSILGLTIDYGPFAFMDHFDPNFICNHSDSDGRYRYEQQPEIGLFNLSRLAEALDPVLPLERSMAFLEANYMSIFTREYNSLLAQKLGFCKKDDFDKFSSS